MKLLLFLAWREIRFRWRQLIPFVLIAGAVIFTSVAQVTFQESANSDDSFDYMVTPSYMILLSAFALIGFVAAKTYFSLYGEGQLGETGTLLAIGMKRRNVRRIRVLLGFLCIMAAAVIAVPLALLYIYLIVSACTTVDMTATNFAPLAYDIPVGNVIFVLVLTVGTMMLGILLGKSGEKSIVSLLRRGKMPLEAENGNGNLPDEGTLANYGKLFVRRSIKRCVKYNLVVAFLLILPMIFLLGASTFTVDTTAHDFTLRRSIPTAAVTDEMIEEVGQIHGVSKTEGVMPIKSGFINHFIGIHVYAEENADLDALRESLKEYSNINYFDFEDTLTIRESNNYLTKWYSFFFIANAVILFAAACITTFALLKSRLTLRRRELSLLRAIGARVEDIKSAVIPETVADYAAGAFFSILFGALGFWGLMADGGGRIDIIPIIVLCLIFLMLSVFVQIRATKNMTSQILADADNRL